jgi:hypothetical protein
VGIYKDPKLQRLRLNLLGHYKRMASLAQPTVRRRPTRANGGCLRAVLQFLLSTYKNSFRASTVPERCHCKICS